MRSLFRRGMVLTCGLLLSCAAARGVEFKEATHGPASLKIVKGVPIVHVYGTAEEMGEQHGKLLGAQARAAV
ncbi:MAG: hypothetical protein ABIF82_14780, partial [Planctomycetota bacterium]